MNIQSSGEAENSSGGGGGVTEAADQVEGSLASLFLLHVPSECCRPLINTH